MRHRVVGKKLGRDMAHRKALLKNLTTSIVEHGSITTTLPKAKYAQPFIEKAITKAKNGKVRELRKAITTEEMIRKIVEEVAPKFEGRNGGYTRLIKLGKRDGDNADMARLELVTEEKKASKKSNTTKVEKEIETEVAEEEEVTVESESEVEVEETKEDAIEESVEEIEEEKEND